MYVHVSAVVVIDLEGGVTLSCVCPGFVSTLYTDLYVHVPT